jgi:hypothetical protein
VGLLEGGVAVGGVAVAVADLLLFEGVARGLGFRSW